MKRIYNSDVRLQTDGMNLPEFFTFKFYTVNKNVNIEKDQDDVDENGYINLDWALLQLIGQGVLCYTLTKRIPDESYPDGYYDTTVTRATNYYVVTAVEPIDPSQSGSTIEIIINLIEDFEDNMMDRLSAETYNRMLNDQELEDSISGLTGRVEALEEKDYSGYATKVELESGVADAKNYAAERDTIVLNSAKQYADQLTNGMATKAWVNNQGYLTEHQDLSGYLTLSDYNRDKQYMADKDWTQTYIAEQDFATKDYVQEVIEGEIPLDNYYTKDQTYNKTEVDDKIAAISTDTFPTRTEMTQAIATASGNTIQWVVNQNYLTEHQSLANYYTKSETDQAIYDATSAITVDLTDYYTSAQTDQKISTATNDMATQTWVGEQGYSTFSGSYNDLTDKPTIPDVSDYYTKSETNNAIATASGNTITWVVNQNYLTEHQDISGKANISDVNSALTAVDTAIEGKQDKGNYVSASTLNNYYTSAQTDTLLNNKADTSDIPDVSNYIDGAVYVSSAKTINFYHGSTIVAQVDATEFIKDGMVTNVAIVNGNLVITFNTDAGQEPISIPLTDIFNPANYYTSAETANAIATASGNTIGWVKEQNYLTQHQSLADYALKTDVTSAVTNATDDMATKTWVGQQGYITEHQSLANYYTSAQTDTNIATVSGMVIQWVINQNYLTEHQSLADYALKTDVTSAITSATDDMATKTWVGQQGYLTQHQSLADYYTSAETNNAIATASANTLTAVENKGYLTTEAEPAFNASAAKNITSNDITNWNGKSDFSGSYNDLTDKPTIPDVSDYYTKSETDQAISDSSFGSKVI